MVCVNALTAGAWAQSPAMQEPWIRRLVELRAKEGEGWDASLVRQGPGRCCRCGLTAAEAASSSGKLRLCSRCMAAPARGPRCAQGAV